MTILFGVVLVSTLGWLRRHPLATAAAGAIWIVVAVQAGIFDPNSSSVSGAVSTVVSLVWLVTLGFALGRSRPLWRSAAGLALVLAAPQWPDPNPFPAMIVLGPWIVGWLVRSHSDLARTLRCRGAEIAAERSRYAHEAVRYERARIARELHDVIAHCMSIVVIQASAGQRVETTDPDATTELFDSIRGLVRQAERDLLGLSRLISPDTPLSADAIHATVEQARAAGTPITIDVAGQLESIPPPIATALTRVLQEGLTNVVKHAPGASTSVHLDIGALAIALEIRNDTIPNPHAPLRDQNGGHGLPGLQDRVSALGGTLNSGPTPSGNWLLRASVPLPSLLGPAHHAARRTRHGRRTNAPFSDGDLTGHLQMRPVAVDDPTRSSRA